MDAKFKSMTAGLAVVAALAVGGIANAASNGSSQPANQAAPAVAVADPATPGDTVDPAGSTADAVDTPADIAADAADAGKPDTDSLQQGDQTGTDTAAEQAGSELPGDDGPNGHADEVGGAAESTTPDTTPAAPAQ